MNIQNKTILVTGSTGGIGTELCKLLMKKGAKLILTCYSAEQLARLKQELGGHGVTVTAEIDSVGGREHITHECKNNGGIDGVINLAGVLEFSMFEQQSHDSIERVMNINLVATMLLCRSLIPLLRTKPEASIVNVGSTFGSIGYPGFAAYCASKAGVKCFTEAIARELADTAINVSYIAPRATSTSLNTSEVNSLNDALGNKSDMPAYVAKEITKVLETNQAVRFLGWPEKLFVRVNALFPGIVHKALVKKLDVIKRYANHKGELS
jgi:short-subunit dehydrogenase